MKKPEIVHQEKGPDVCKNSIYGRTGGGAGGPSADVATEGGGVFRAG